MLVAKKAANRKTARAKSGTREEGRYRTGRARDDDHGPDLQHDVDDPSPRSERVPDLRGDGQQLHGGEKEGVTEGADLRPLSAALDEIDQDRPDRIDDDRRQHDDGEPRQQPAVPLFPAREALQLLVDHPGSVLSLADVV